MTESDDPWYITHKKTEESKKSHHRKEMMDPLNDMKKYLGEKKKSSEKAFPQEKRKCLETAHSHSPAQVCNSFTETCDSYVMMDVFTGSFKREGS